MTHESDTGHHVTHPPSSLHPDRGDHTDLCISDFADTTIDVISVQSAIAGGFGTTEALYAHLADVTSKQWCVVLMQTDDHIAIRWNNDFILTVVDYDKYCASPAVGGDSTPVLME